MAAFPAEWRGAQTAPWDAMAARGFPSPLGRVASIVCRRRRRGPGTLPFACPGGLGSLEAWKQTSRRLWRVALCRPPPPAWPHASSAARSCRPPSHTATTTATATATAETTVGPSLELARDALARPSLPLAVSVPCAVCRLRVQPRREPPPTSGLKRASRDADSNAHAEQTPPPTVGPQVQRSWARADGLAIGVGTSRARTRKVL